jgi:hypothetical protein
MKTTEFALKIADLFLKSERETSGWTRVKSLRRCWYFLFFYVFFFVLTSIGVTVSPLRRVIESSAAYTSIYRVFGIISWSIISGLVVALAALYFRYVIRSKHPVVFRNVINFYSFSLISWMMLYQTTYLLYPGSFIYHNPPLSPSPVLIESGKLLLVRLDFLLFAALQSLGGSYYKIRATSILTATFVWVQCLFTFSLVALLIASYVNQKSQAQGTNRDH